MKKAFKIIAVILAVAIIVSGVVIGITKKEECNYFFSAMHNAQVKISDGTWKDDVNGANSSGSNENVQSSFAAGTYGGIEFKSVDDVVNYYVQAYDKTKADTATYIDEDGKEQVCYALVGDEKLKITNVLVDGKENSIINNLVPSIVDSIFTTGVYGLPPCTSREQQYDNDENGDSLLTSRIKPEDIENCSVADNGDGTITLTLIPKKCDMSRRGMDAQGKMFNALGAIDKTVDSIDVLSWASGSTSENCLVTYENGTAIVKIDTNSEKIVEADYDMKVTVTVNHANVLVIKDKSASLTVDYIQHFPASDEFIKESKGLVRK